MTEEPSTRFRLGRSIALIGLVVALSLAIIFMSLLAVELMPQIFPTLFPATG